MVKWERKKVDITPERRILIGLIVSKKFIQEALPLINLSYFQNPHIRTVAEWAIDFFLTYDEPPLANIQDIFLKRKDGLKPELAEMIETLLEDISERFALEGGINEEYFIDQTMEYFKKRELEITTGNIQVLLDKDDVKGAEDQIIQFRKISRLTSGWFNPLDEEEIKEVFYDTQDFFRFPGKLGEFVGNIEKNWLVSVVAPYKRGKTFMLQEFAVIGILSHKRVAFFSLEMGKKETKERILKRLTASAGDGGDFIYPCFDCLQNQTGSCERKERVNKIPLTDESGRPPKYDPELKYRPCSVCRDKNSADYQMTTWFEPINRPPFDPFHVSKAIKAYREQYGHFLRVMVYPKFSANVGDIQRDLDILEQTEDYIPEIIIIDHAEILKGEDAKLEGYGKEDETWMALSRLAGERSALVVTAGQITGEGLKAPILRQQHKARWKGATGHVDLCLGLNQTDQEKEMGVMRVNKIADRHHEYNENHTCTILQKFQVGQVHLDSHVDVVRERGT